MTGSARGLRLPAVSTPGHAQVVLELDIAPERIRGTIRDARGASRPFEGWTQLTSLLEAARVPSPDGVAPAVIDGADEGENP